MAKWRVLDNCALDGHSAVVSRIMWYVLQWRVRNEQGVESRRQRTVLWLTRAQ
jgi:hypothetical protein